MADQELRPNRGTWQQKRTEPGGARKGPREGVQGTATSLEEDGSCQCFRQGWRLVEAPDPRESSAPHCGVAQSDTQEEHCGRAVSPCSQQQKQVCLHPRTQGTEQGALSTYSGSSSPYRLLQVGSGSHLPYSRPRAEEHRAPRTLVTGEGMNPTTKGGAWEPGGGR